MDEKQKRDLMAQLIEMQLEIARLRFHLANACWESDMLDMWTEEQIADSEGRYRRMRKDVERSYRQTKAELNDAIRQRSKLKRQLRGAGVTFEPRR